MAEIGKNRHDPKADRPIRRGNKTTQADASGVPNSQGGSRQGRVVQPRVTTVIAKEQSKI